MYFSPGFDWGFIPWAHNCFSVYRNPVLKDSYLFRGDYYWLNSELEEEEYDDIFSYQIEDSEKHHFNFEACLNNSIILRGYSRQLFNASGIEDVLINFTALAEIEIEDKKVITMGYNPHDLSLLKSNIEANLLYFDLYDNSPVQINPF